MAKLCRRACGDTGGVPVACSRRASSRRTARGPDAPPAAAQEQRRAVRWPGGGEPRPPGGHVPFQRLAGLGAERHEAILAPLALANPHACAGAVVLHVVDVEVAGLGDAEAGAVDDLEERPAERPALAASASGLGPRRLAAADRRLPCRGTWRSRFACLGARSAATGLERTRPRRTARRKNARSDDSFRRWSRRRSAHGARQGRSGTAPRQARRAPAPARAPSPAKATSSSEVVQIGAKRVLGRALLGGQELAKHGEGHVHGGVIVAQPLPRRESSNLPR